MVFQNTIAPFQHKCNRKPSTAPCGKFRFKVSGILKATCLNEKNPGTRPGFLKYLFLWFIFYFFAALTLANTLCSTMKKHRSAATAILDQELSSFPLVFTSVEIVPLISTPKKEPITFPTPPVRRVPPITADAMASISSPSAVSYTHLTLPTT